MEVKTIELLEGDHGTHTWPCAPVLAQYVYQQRDSLKGKHVLELGAGTAIPGIVAAKCGAHVILSDREGNPRLQENLIKTCELNELVIGEEGKPGISRIMEITWGVFSPEVLTLEPQDIILASDCFYDSKDFEDIVATMCFMLQRNSKCCVWVTYQERSSDRSLLPLLKRWDLTCRTIPPHFYPAEDKQSQVRVCGLSDRLAESVHAIDTWEIRRKNT